MCFRRIFSDFTGGCVIFSLLLNLHNLKHNGFNSILCGKDPIQRRNDPVEQ